VEADHGIVRLSIVSGITAIGDDGSMGLLAEAEEAATWLVAEYRLAVDNAS